MRCWDCKGIMVLPEIIGGKPGIAGMLRAGLVDDTKKTPQVVSQEVSCGCGAHYLLTVARKPGYVKVSRAESEPDKEAGRGWK